ncbi:unnamed protein product [Brachionus calyciflorus]|uniref:Uncharacterized protein n=1 Tax=Brachionus calyciflorus TaxID=104777 RepID=A0A814J1L7_9BILA|nr:unnamed protein product [Brachionus calyciflorus]
MISKCFLVLLLSTLSSAQDYFYEDGLSPQQIEEIRINKTRVELEKRLKETTTTELPPDWFNKKPNEDDPLSKFMQEKFKEYLEQFKKEQADKIKAQFKSKSNIDHSFWSLITLTVFFGTGISISLIIILVKSNHVQSMAKKKKKQKKCLENVEYLPVKQSELNV